MPEESAAAGQGRNSEVAGDSSDHALVHPEPVRIPFGALPAVRSAPQGSTFAATFLTGTSAAPWFAAALITGDPTALFFATAWLAAFALALATDVMGAKDGAPR